MLEHKGYSATVEFDDEAGIFHGEVLELRDVVTFQADNVEDLVKAFRDSVDDYLEFCEAENVAPDKPFKGNLMLRLTPEIHRRVFSQSKKDGKSINQWILDQLNEAV